MLNGRKNYSTFPTGLLDSDPSRGFRKRNKLLKRAEAAAPILAVLLFFFCGGFLVYHQRHVSHTKKVAAESAKQLSSAQADHAHMMRLSDSHRELAAARFKHAENSRVELEALDRKHRELEVEGGRKQAIIMGLELKVTELAQKVDEGVVTQLEAMTLRSEMELLKARYEHMMHSLSEKDRELREAQNQLAELRHTSRNPPPEHVASKATPQGPSQAAPPVDPEKVGWHDLPPEAHTGFRAVAKLLGEQGIVDPAGSERLAKTLANFFEDRMGELMAHTATAHLEGSTARSLPNLGKQLGDLLVTQGVHDARGREHMDNILDHMVKALHQFPPAGADAGTPAATPHHPQGSRRDLGQHETAHPAAYDTTAGHVGRDAAAHHEGHWEDHGQPEEEGQGHWEPHHTSWEHEGVDWGEHGDHHEEAHQETAHPDPHLEAHHAHQRQQAAQHAAQQGTHQAPSTPQSPEPHRPPDTRPQHGHDAAGFIW